MQHQASYRQEYIMAPKFHVRSLAAIALAAGLAGQAGAQTSKKLTQVSNTQLSQSGNAGIWGWVHPDGTEYALPTTRSGVAIVSLKDPKSPKELFPFTS